MSTVEKYKKPQIFVLPTSRIKQVCYWDEEAMEWVMKEEFSSVFGNRVMWIGDTFHKIWDCKARFLILKGGSGSGKSHYIARRLIMKVLEQPYCRVLYLRKHFSDIKKSCFQLFKDIISTYNLDKYFICRESDYEIECINGNKLLPGGLDNPEKLKSIEGITDVWFEEVITRNEKIESAEFRMVVQRLRTNKSNLQFFLSFNPVDTDNFIYNDFVLGNSYVKYDFDNPSSSNTFLLHTSTYLDNVFLPQSFVDDFEILRKESPYEYEVYALAHWGNPKTGKEWVHAFDRRKHVVPKIEHNKTKSIFLSIDHNVNPYITCLVSQYYSDSGVRNLKVIDEICLEDPHNDIYSLLDELKRRGYVKKGITIYWTMDLSSKNRISGFGNQETKNVYQEFKRIIKPFSNTHSDLTLSSKKNPGKYIARTAVNRIFANLEKDLPKISNIRIEISEICVHLIKDLSDLQSAADGYNPERTTIDGVTFERLGHCYSALVYLFLDRFKDYFKRVTIKSIR